MPALVIAQSGGPTAVVNASLVGALQAARESQQVPQVLGARFGIEGILRDDYRDLTGLSDAECVALEATPSAALGSSRYRPTDLDIEQIGRNLARREVRWVTLIGGNDSADTLHRVAQGWRAASARIAVVGIPKTVDNDLLHMDHCPGYGSAARYIAIAAREATLDTAAMRNTDPIHIIEVMGRNAGWLAAASALGRSEPRGAPHVIFVPERPRSLPQMLAEIREAHEAHGWAVVVLSENQRDEAGRPLGSGQPVYVDPYGHPYFEGAGAYLARVAQPELGLRCRYDRPGSLQRSSSGTLSSVDLAEARAVGADAVRRALAGESDVMVTIERTDGPGYGVTLGSIRLKEVAGRERRLPDDFIHSSGTDVTEAFLDYARPLIGGPLPPVFRLF